MAELVADLEPGGISAVSSQAFGCNLLKVVERRAFERMTYEKLATQTSISRATLESIASRDNYNTTLSTISKLCSALQCQPGELLELDQNENHLSREN